VKNGEDHFLLLYISLTYVLVAALVLSLFLLRWPVALQGLLLAGDGDIVIETKRALARRTAQVERAAADSSAIWNIGTSTSQIGGISGADRGRTLALSARDLSTHLLVTGATGSGKTSGVLRPLAAWWSARKGVGLLVMDGKGDLPSEFDGKLPSFKLLVPGRDCVDLLAGLEPHDICVALSQSADASDYWSRAGAEVLYSAAVIAHAASIDGTAKYNLISISRIMSETKFRVEICIGLAKKLTDEQRTLQRALSFFSAWDPEKNNTQAGVLSTAQSWVNGILRHPDLLSWAAPMGDEPAINVADVLRGARYGIDVPEYRYGEAAGAVTALLRAQVYKDAKRRGGAKDKDYAPCLVLIDEAALALGALEQQILPVARSLGLCFACATQNIEQFSARFGESGARAMIDQFRSLIALSSSAQTQEYVRQRAGVGVVRVREPTGAPAYRQIVDREATQGMRTWQSLHEGPTVVAGLLRLTTGVFAGDAREASDKIAIGPLIPQEIALSDGEAICVLNRANTPRVETAMLARTFS
jgi:TraM recognition site of TraD and TraG